MDASRRSAEPRATLPAAPPYTLRGAVLTPLDGGGTAYLPDALVEVDAAGRIRRVEAWPHDGDLAAATAATAPGSAATAATAATAPDSAATAPVSDAAPLYDLRPLLLLPGLVDLHLHIPQIPNAGIGAGLDLLAWLDRYTLPLEQRFDRRVAAAFAPLAFEAIAGAGTTTIAAYVTSDADATDAVFEAAEVHGIRAVLGHVLMDRWLGSPAREMPATATAALDASERLCERWHCRDGGRIRYAFTPRFAVSCSPELLAGSARLAAQAGAHWQTHLSEDWRELTEVHASFPEARDYLDVYEQAGALGPNALFAHAVHLSDSEAARLAASGAAVAHCPASNLFLPSGIMPLARHLAAGVRVGLGSDVSGGPSLSIFETMRVGAYVHTALETAAPETPDAPHHPAPTPLDWLRLGTLDGARALGLGDAIGSIEPGKEADLIAVDAALTEPVAALPEGWVDRSGDDALSTASDLMSRLIFRTHPEMVRGSWVRGRLLPARTASGRAGVPSG